jgi:antitoxin ParD1/3/4
MAMQPVGWTGLFCLKGYAMNMNLEITPEIKEKIDNLIRAGDYETESEVIDDALNLLQKRNQLRSDIQEGILQLDRGEFFEEDQIFDALEQKAAKLAQADDK